MDQKLRSPQDLSRYQEHSRLELLLWKTQHPNPKNGLYSSCPSKLNQPNWRNRTARMVAKENLWFEIPQTITYLVVWVCKGSQQGRRGWEQTTNSRKGFEKSWRSCYWAERRAQYFEKNQKQQKSILNDKELFFVANQPKAHLERKRQKGTHFIWHGSTSWTKISHPNCSLTNARHIQRMVPQWRKNSANVGEHQASLLCQGWWNKEGSTWRGIGCRDCGWRINIPEKSGLYGLYAGQKVLWNQNAFNQLIDY